MKNQSESINSRHGNFKAETYNERELEKLLRENGTFWETLADFDASRAQGEVK